MTDDQRSKGRNQAGVRISVVLRMTRNFESLDRLESGNCWCRWAVRYPVVDLARRTKFGSYLVLPRHLNLYYGTLIIPSE